MDDVADDTLLSDTLPEPEDLVVSQVCPAEHVSPLAVRRKEFVDEGDGVLTFARKRQLDQVRAAGKAEPSFELAGPREMLAFQPEGLACGIVTCGGLCPGINDVIRSIVLTLRHHYGVRHIIGYRYGYAGLAATPPAEPVLLHAERVENIHLHGGTLLGSSRGPQDLGVMTDTLLRSGVGLLFALGGDGTLRGASALAAEIARRGLKIGVVGVPKTIDNDLLWTERSFGFSTAVDEARKAIAAAHAESRGAWNGIGIVKLMGRHSGFITAHATLASGDVNFCLVPEVPFFLEGSGGFLEALEKRIIDRHHAVVAIAEGAGQDLVEQAGAEERDASGNVRLRDIGSFLREQIERHFAARGISTTVKYIDPSYTIRSLPANSMDSAFCLALGQHAVHAGLAGRTDMMVGYWNHTFTHVPLRLVAGKRKRLDPHGEVWRRVLATTGQPLSCHRTTRM
ncbi:MAG: ATP-dependent 6-phosphofructokinase [Gemmatimonadales bacterium]|jgi:6-phosphofructokinase 1